MGLWVLLLWVSVVLLWPQQAVWAQDEIVEGVERDELPLPVPSRKVPKLVDRCGLCKALVTELHGEVHLHNMLRKFAEGGGGEEAVYDSVWSSCLGVVQNYSVAVGGVLRKRRGVTEEERELEMEKEAQANPGAMGLAVVLKESCIELAEEFEGELSGALWKLARAGWSASDTAARICVRNVPVCPKVTGKRAEWGGGGGGGRPSHISESQASGDHTDGPREGVTGEL
eukprot:RCo035467